MSEAERKRRQDYKRNRKKWIWIQAIAIAVAVALALTSFLVYDRMNRTYYIEYTEGCTVDYLVQYKENSFFDEEWIPSGQSYVTSLTEAVKTDFHYVLNMDAEDIGFEYTYTITSQLIVSDKDTGAHIFDPTEVIRSQTRFGSGDSSSISLEESVTVDFKKYASMAEQFIDVYGLTNATGMLAVKMTVDVLSNCESFEQSNENRYEVSVLIPLCEENFSIEVTSAAPTTESKVLACKTAVNQNVFLVLAIVFAALSFLFGCVLTAFIYITRNEDITYASKVRRLVSSYRSFIQQMEGTFDSEGYQIVRIKTFNEMLWIRDTIQSPILMSENEDETKTEFLIPTNTKILYMFEIRVENYDEIYGLAEEVEEPVEVEEHVVESETETAIVLEEDIDDEAIKEALETPDVSLDDIDFVPVDEPEYTETEEAPGVEVVGVVWPERPRRNKVYRYDPNGEQLSEGDMVLVPTRDVARDREVIRKATIAQGNHRIDPDSHPYPLKKIIAVIRRHAEAALTRTKDDPADVSTEESGEPKE